MHRIPSKTSVLATAGKFQDVKRRGAVLPLVALFMVIMMAMAAFAIDLAYLNLVKTQLRTSTDAAAKTGASALLQGLSPQAVQDAVIKMAALNTVAAKPLVLTAANVSLGQAILQPDGTYKFTPGIQPYQSVQVQANLTSGTASGVPALFGSALGHTSYSLTNTAVATASACDACLVLDRSNSMCWDNSGTAFTYPSPVGTNIPMGIQTPPLAGSRWVALESAVQTFCNVVGSTSGSTQVGVVTWASPIGPGTPEYTLTGQTSPGVTVELGLSTNMASVYSSVQARSQKMMMGATDMASGMTQGMAVLTGTGSRPSAKKVMILMTDGQWTAGTVNPVTVANTALAGNITIHCICFLPNADQTTCQKIASITGGKFFYASDTASLNAAFEQIAYSLPVALTL